MKATATISLLLLLLLSAGCVSAGTEIRPAEAEFAFVDLTFEG